MTNPLIGQVLGSVFGNAMRQRQAGRSGGGFGMPGGGGMGGGSMGGGPLGGGLGGGGLGGGGLGGGLGGAALGGILGGLMGRGRSPMGGGRSPLGGNRGMLIAMLLPFVMQWVQRNGGLGAVLQRMRQKGYEKQAQSWVSTGANEGLAPAAVDDVMDAEEIGQIADRLGVPRQEVKQAFAEILPEMVNQLTPDGQVQPEADEVLRESIPLMEREVEAAQREGSTT
jgi:uncharacterized protein YidB (DUF937 family)